MGGVGEFKALGDGEGMRLRKGLLDERLSVKPADRPGWEPTQRETRLARDDGPLHANDDGHRKT